MLTVVSASSPAHGHGVRSLQCQGTVTVTVPKSCYSLLSSIFFPNQSMLSLSAQFAVMVALKIMFVPKLAVPKRKQLDRMKVNLAPQVSFA